MMNKNSAKTALAIALVVATFPASSEAAKKKPQAVPSAPAAAPVQENIPYRPWMPEQPSGTLIIPPKDASGVRPTVNTGASPMQKSWNLRSAYNVAALNCRAAKHAAILVNYRGFLRVHARGLTAANRAVDTEFRGRHGAVFVKQREAYMTRVYNFYALPPTTPAFCDAALLMSEQAKLAKAGTLNALSAQELPKIDAVIEDFYNRYDQWKKDGAAWDARYAAMYKARYGVLYPGSSIPGAPVPAPK